MESRVSERPRGIGCSTGSPTLDSTSKDRSDRAEPPALSNSEIYPSNSAARAAEEAGPNTVTRRSPGRVMCNSTPAPWLGGGLLMQVGSQKTCPGNQMGVRGPGKVQIRPREQTSAPATKDKAAGKTTKPTKHQAQPKKTPRRLSAVARARQSPKVTPHPLN